MANVGFIGLGIMGAPMAGHLIKGGHRVCLHSHGGIPPALTDAGGIACANGRDVAEKADVVITMVPDTPHVQDVLVGGNGDGQTTKVANQIIVALTIEAVGEALLYAAKAGADPGKVRQALMGGFASSKILEVHGERMVKRTFDPGFRIELHQKDLNLALSSARQLKVSLPNTATAQELFNSCAAHGGSAWDHSAMVRALELMANFEIGQIASEDEAQSR